MRKAELKRNTKETNVVVSINLDGAGLSKINTPFGMLSHMLEQISKHANIDLEVNVDGDVETGSHHVLKDHQLV